MLMVFCHITNGWTTSSALSKSCDSLPHGMSCTFCIASCMTLFKTKFKRDGGTQTCFHLHREQNSQHRALDQSKVFIVSIYFFSELHITTPCITSKARVKSTYLKKRVAFISKDCLTIILIAFVWSHQPLFGLKSIVSWKRWILFGTLIIIRTF